MEKIFKVEGMHCEHCSVRVKKAIEALDAKCDIDLSKGVVTVTAENVDDKKINDTIEDLGFIVK